MEGAENQSALFSDVGHATGSCHNPNRPCPQTEATGGDDLADAGVAGHRRVPAYDADI